jgi:Ca-activated chloride channel homolog
LKKFYLILWLNLVFTLLYGSLSAQYFFTGEVKDIHGDKLQNGSILVRSTGSSYSPGSYGEFEIISRAAEDSLILSFDGYEPYTTAVNANAFLKVTLKNPSFPKSPKKIPVKCLYDGLKEEDSFVDKCGSVSFTGDISRASYGMVKRFLDMGSTVPPEAVQIEELLNYFNFHHEEPENANLFNCSPTLLSCPWNQWHKLLCLNICAKKVDLRNAPPANLVFLIDASGSMDMPNKLPIIKSGMRLLIDNLRDIDNVSLIAFGGRVRPILIGVPGTARAKMIRAIQELSADGPTPGEEAIRLAYEVAHRQFIAGGNNRIVLITDGDISENASGEKELEDLVSEQSQDGIRLDAIGVGMGNFTDSRLPRLAQIGHGDFAFAADEQEAERLLAAQLTPTSFTIADGVAVTTDFDTALVQGYRLIGYDNKQSVSEDTAFRLEGRKVSSGHSMLAIFELIPKIDSTGKDTVAGITIHYCLPGQTRARTAGYYCSGKPIAFDKAKPILKRAVCIAMLGMKLRDETGAVQVTWPDIEKIAKKNFSANDCMDKEFMALLARAKQLYRQDLVDH